MFRDLACSSAKHSGVNDGRQWYWITPNSPLNGHSRFLVRCESWSGHSAVGGIGMSEYEKLREQAARLLALALKARERGDGDLADQLTAQAAAYLDKATTLNSPPADARSSEHVAQQQQQPQSRDHE